MGKKGLGRRGKEEEGDWGGEEGGSACNGPIVYALSASRQMSKIIQSGKLPFAVK